ncbi:YdaU family protein [Hydrogenophaga sp.]|uniref:YdaU family protein n=1 Tax=Hydrogenophaga sp. TaxID=1904254 RepID=UPI00271A9611|nr:YdaU family protein [Hydrogenophaga sp.]MDO9131991.1 YdaU family protein [Hydrogenophaga sp.]
MNYYKRHIGDYAAATRHLSMLEHGAYTMLLDIYYTSEQPLPADLKAAARKAGARAKDEIAAVETVLQEFFVLEEDGWHQKRCDVEIAAMQAKQDQNKAIGKLGGRPKKEPNAAKKENPDGFQEETQTVSENEDSSNQNITQATSHKPLANTEDGENDSAVLPCPQQEIIELYHRLLPAGRQVREWTPARQSVLRSRWREKAARQKLEWWERFFTYCAASDFLTGKTSTPGRKPFEVSLDWLVKSENMAKVIEGAYENERAAA